MPSALRLRSSVLEMSWTVVATPPFVLCEFGKGFPSRCRGSFVIFAGFVRLEWRNAGPVDGPRVLAREDSDAHLGHVPILGPVGFRLRRTKCNRKPQGALPAP